MNTQRFGAFSGEPPLQRIERRRRRNRAVGLLSLAGCSLFLFIWFLVALAGHPAASHFWFTFPSRRVGGWLFMCWIMPWLWPFATAAGIRGFRNSRAPRR